MVCDVIKINKTMTFWPQLMLAVIFLVVMHLVFANTGGSGADLPEPLLVWSAMLLLIGGCAWCLRRQSLRGTAFSRGVIVAAVLLTLPLCWSPSRDWQLDALPRLAGLWAGVALYYLLLNCRLTEKQQQRVLWFIVISTAIQAIYSLLEMWQSPWLLESTQQTFHNRSLFSLGVFQQRNVTASFIATGAAILLWLTVDGRFRVASLQREKYRLWGCAAGIVLFYSTLVLLKSRAGWLGGLACWVTITAVFFFSQAREQSSQWSRRIIAIAPVLGIILGVNLLSASFLDAVHEHDGSNLERVFILQQTWQMIMQHPFKGWGYGGFPWSFAHFVADQTPALTRRVPELTYPHNEILFWWVEGGIIPLLALVILLFCGVRLLLRRPGSKQLALFACLLPIMIHTQLEYPLYQSSVHWLLVLLLLNFADTYPSDTPEQAAEKPSLHIVPVTLFILATGGVLLTGYTFWQGRYLTAFQQSPENYANRVLQLHETGIGTERLRKDQALSYILRYQRSGDVSDLQMFNKLGSRWIRTWNDADMYNNLINVKQFIGGHANSIALKDEAHHLYPDDLRFM